MESAQNPKLDLEKQVSNIVQEEMVKVISKPEHSSDISSTLSSHHVAGHDAEKDRPTEALQQTPTEEEPVYPSNKKLIPIMGSLYLSFFLIALVRPSYLHTHYTS